MTHSPFAVRGIVEGFYGVFYTVHERNDLIRFMAKHGYNLYVYGPKNDRWHRERWREPYPADVMAHFASTVATANEVGITFCYAIGPGITICYASEDEFRALTAKARAFYDLGVRAFSLLLDDIAPVFHCEEDRERYGSYGEAHADLCNRLYEWLQALDDTCTLSMCPTDYHGAPPFDAYLHDLGEQLHPAIDVFYTGVQVCSPTIAVEEVAAFAEAVRRPPLIWDNYPVNDLAMSPRMHIGPILGRDPALSGVARGMVANPMNQPEASKVALHTYAAYLRDPRGYEPEAAWEQALREVGGDKCYPALRLFAENSLDSCLGAPQATTLQGLVDAVLNSLRQGVPPSRSEALRALEQYVLDVENAGYDLKNRSDNYALRSDLLLWLDLLDNWVWMTRRAVEVLGKMEAGEPYEQSLKRMGELLHIATHHAKQWAGEVLVPLADYVREQAIRQEEEARYADVAG